MQDGKYLNQESTDLKTRSQTNSNKLDWCHTGKVLSDTSSKQLGSRNNQSTIHTTYQTIFKCQNTLIRKTTVIFVFAFAKLF